MPEVRTALRLVFEHMAHTQSHQNCEQLKYLYGDSREPSRQFVVQHLVGEEQAAEEVQEEEAGQVGTSKQQRSLRRLVRNDKSKPIRKICDEDRVKTKGEKSGRKKSRKKKK